MKKEIGDHAAEISGQAREPWLDLDAHAALRLTSENPAHPIESALQERNGAGWKTAHAGPQTIWLRFDSPQAISELHLRFEAIEQRTQEFLLLWSSDGGVTDREIVRQQFNFSPGAAMVEDENYFPDLANVTDLKLTIIPDISGGAARATLRALRIR